jgi:hypothetical protein
MLLIEDKPFERIKKIKMPSEVADALEDFKLAIVRNRASGFTDIEQSDMLSILNALRHYVLMPKKA